MSGTPIIYTETGYGMSGRTRVGYFDENGQIVMLEDFSYLDLDLDLDLATALDEIEAEP